MKQLREEILHCLASYAGDQDLLVRELDRIIACNGDETCQMLLQILTNLKLSPAEALTYWDSIINHRVRLRVELDRDVSLQTAICDYFSSVQKSFINPKIVEIQLFEDTVRESRYDGLTGLMNRKCFDEELEKQISRAKRYNQDLSVVFFDLDDFKKVNDTYGHQAGDEVLRRCSSLMKTCIRTGDTAARYGGEELVLLLPNTGKGDAYNLAERIRHEIQRAIVFHEENAIGVTISGGVASYPNDASDSEGIIRSSDKAMYQAKAAGKNKISLSTPKNRKSYRYDFKNDIWIRCMGEGSARKISATSKNISVDGILFETDSLLSLGSTIEVTITDRNEKIYLIGNVVRVMKTSSDQFDIGVSFPSRIKDTVADHLLNPRQGYSTAPLYASH